MPTHGGAMDTVALALVAVALLNVVERNRRNSLALLTLQGLLLTAAALGSAVQSAEAHAYLAVLLTLAVKVAGIPGTLYSSVRDVALPRSQSLVLPQRAVLALALAAMLTAFYVVGPLTPAGLQGSPQALPASVAVMLLGLLAMLVQRGALAQVIGLVTMENGLYFAAVAATHGLPFVVELGVAVDALVAVVVMTLLSRRMHDTLGTTNTDLLRSLRG